jgi:hypothetical protein
MNYPHHPLQVAAHRCKAHDGYVSESQEGLVLVAFRDPAQVQRERDPCSGGQGGAGKAWWPLTYGEEGVLA